VEVLLLKPNHMPLPAPVVRIKWCSNMNHN
jgi:hypothetical protein